MSLYLCRNRRMLVAQQQYLWPVFRIYILKKKLLKLVTRTPNKGLPFESYVNPPAAGSAFVAGAAKLKLVNGATLATGAPPSVNVG